MCFCISGSELHIKMYPDTILQQVELNQTH